MSRKPQYWLLKSEPSEYSFTRLQKERRTLWTGIRNFEARNNLRAMQPGDLALYYHSGEGKNIVGIARISSDAKSDPTAAGEDWSSVEVEPVAALSRPIALSELKNDPRFGAFPLIRRGRLSVAPVSENDFKTILKLGDTPIPTPPGMTMLKTQRWPADQ